MLPPRKPTKGVMGTRKGEGPLRCPTHLQWVRSTFFCPVNNTGSSVGRAAHDVVMCSKEIEAAHVRRGSNAGIGQKPDDSRVIPLCSKHHRIQHQIGEAEFEKRFGIDMLKIAEGLAAKSPALKRLRMKERE